MTKILMLSGDPAVFTEGSEVGRRMEEYASIFDELVVVTPAVAPTGIVKVKNLILYPVYRRHVLLTKIGMAAAAFSLCKKNNFDVISVQAPDEMGLAGFIISRVFHTPLQVQIHSDVMSPWYRRAGWKEFIRYGLAKFLILRADCIRVVSERIRKSILGKSDFKREVRLQKISVLPIFTDISKFLNAKRDDNSALISVSPKARNQRVSAYTEYDFKMITVGRFVDKEKNFSMLIDMMRDFIKICPKALLVIVGDGQDRKNYESRIKNQGLEKYVILEKWRNDLPSFYKSFDLYLMPSNYEGWGRTVIEAQASGLPVVMTDVGLAGEVVKDRQNGRVVAVGDKGAFLAACLDLYRNSTQRKEFAQNGLEAVKNIEPKTKEEYLKLYADSFKHCSITPIHKLYTNDTNSGS